MDDALRRMMMEDEKGINFFSSWTPIWEMPFGEDVPPETTVMFRIREKKNGSSYLEKKERR